MKSLLIILCIGFICPMFAQTPKPVLSADSKERFGKVTKVNPIAKTITMVVEGKEVTFYSEKLKAVPKVGDIITFNKRFPWLFENCEDCNKSCPNGVGVCFMTVSLECMCYPIIKEHMITK